MTLVFSGCLFMLANMAPFTHTVRVYWEDTDGGGIVYYANYLKFAERARTEWLRNLSHGGHDQTTLRDQEGVLFVVRECNARFRTPARLDDVLDVSVTVEKATRHKLQLRQMITCGGTACVELIVELVALNAKTRELAIIPELGF